jgi:transposase
MPHPPGGKNPMRPPGSTPQLEARRLKAWRLLRDGVAPVAVARRLGVDRRSVRRWRAQGELGGRCALACHPSPGRPPRLDAAQRGQLVGWLLAGAEASGFPTPLWTCPRVAELIRRRFKSASHRRESLVNASHGSSPAGGPRPEGLGRARSNSTGCRASRDAPSKRPIAGAGSGDSK